MKKLLITTLLGLILAVDMQAVSLSVANVSPTVTNLLQSYGTITSVRVDNTNSTTALVYLYNASTSNILYTNASYTYNIPTNVTCIDIYTNTSLGTQIFTNSYPCVSNVVVTTGTTTNTYPLLTVLSVPPTNSTTFSSSTGLRFTSGITMTNDKIVSVTITYNK